MEGDPCPLLKDLGRKNPVCPGVVECAGQVRRQLGNNVYEKGLFPHIEVLQKMRQCDGDPSRLAT
ncbi:MAG: hypothetical protein V2A63_01090 [Patescibacteria group bacterium]